MRGSGLTAALVLLAAASSAAADLSRLARGLGEAARAAGLKRVAVSRFEPTKGGEDRRGNQLAERVVVALVQDGRVQAVERNLLAKIADEISLSRTGAVEGGSRRAVRLAAVDGLIVGRFASDGRRLRVYAHLVQLETGLIVGAATAEVDDDEGSVDPFDVPVPALRAEFPALDADDLRDAPASDGGRCSGAALKVARMQDQVLELKARFWAFRMRLGLDAADVTVNPGTTIPDSALRARFYERLGALHAQERLAPMTEQEMRDLARVEGESYALVRDCGL